MRCYGRIGVVLLTVVAVAASLLVASNLQAQEPLRWKFEKGQKLDYNMTQDMGINTSGGPLGNQNVTMHQEMKMKWDVDEVTKEGDAKIRQRFDSVQMKMTIPPIGAVEYDSKSKEAPVGPAAMLAPMYKALTESEFELTMTARGEIKDVKIPEKLITALKNSPGAAAMGDMATPEGFKKMVSQGALVLPEKAPEKGQEWSTKVEMNNPAGGKQVVETTYRYEDTKEIDGVTYAVFRPNLKMGFTGNNQAQIKQQESKGEILFNVGAGRLHSSTLEQDVSMQQMPGFDTKINQTIKVEVTPSDETAEASGAVQQ